jgi:hypothetical protein
LLIFVLGAALNTLNKSSVMGVLLTPAMTCHLLVMATTVAVELKGRHMAADSLNTVNM